MGVRGLTTLLQLEPTRYGHKWSPTTQQTIYIDGPALLYHILCQSPISPKPHTPYTVRSIATVFLSQILKSCSEVTIIFDGPAPSLKLRSQIERMEGKSMRLSRSDNDVSRYVPHLFADQGLQEACSDLNITVIEGEGEAEMDIVKLLQESGEKNFVIISNDSDLLVYDGCPGYIDLKSLNIWENDTGRCCCTGWFWDREKVLNCFKLRSEAMPVVAALAGCDYDLGDEKLNKRLKFARGVVLASDKGGLKRKEKKGEVTAKRGLIAVTRFVSYWGGKGSKTNNCDDFLKNIAWAAAGEGKGNNERCEELIKVLNEFITLYDCSKGGFCKNKTTGADLKRLLDQGVFLCRPVCEAWETKRRKNKKVKKGDGFLVNDGVWMSNSFVLFRKRLYFYLDSIHNGVLSSKGITEYFQASHKVLQYQSIHLKPIDWLDSTSFSCASGQTDVNKVLEFILSLNLDDESLITSAVQSEHRLVFFAGLILLPHDRISALLLCAMSTAPTLLQLSTINTNDEFNNTPNLQKRISMVQVACHHTLILLHSLCHLSNYLQDALAAFSASDTFREELTHVIFSEMEIMGMIGDFDNVSLEVNIKPLLRSTCNQIGQLELIDEWYISLKNIWNKWCKCKKTEPILFD